MLRLAVFLGLAAAILTGPASAGQTSGRFTVGITITGKKLKPPPLPVRQYTWGAAAVTLARAGFADPQRLEASETLYWFTAARDGEHYRVAVSIASGEIVKVIPRVGHPP